jgi:uncharacterized membrane protein (UPF0127 family)
MLTGVRRWILIVGLIALVVAACSSNEPMTAGETTTTSVESSGALDASASVTTITIDDTEYRVAVADSPERRARGLMGVTALGQQEGMLFAFAENVGSGFWMKDTLIPLDIAFFDADGGYVDGFEMVPCTEDPCPSYTPSGSYRYAVEAAAGELSGVGPGSVLRAGPEGMPVAES